MMTYSIAPLIRLHIILILTPILVSSIRESNIIIAPTTGTDCLNKSIFVYIYIYIDKIKNNCLKCKQITDTVCAKAELNT